MELARRVRASFLLVVILMGLAAGVLIWNQVRTQKAFDIVLATARLENLLLECRREEKNFFLRQQLVYAVRVRQHLDGLRETAAAIEPLNEEIRQLVEQFERRRVEYAEALESATSAVGAVDPEDPDTQLVQAARACHDVAAEIRDTTASEFERMSSTMHVVNFASILIAAVASVFLAGYLTDRILESKGTEPL